MEVCFSPSLLSPRLPAVQRRLRHRAHQGPTHPRPASAGARYLVHLIQRPLGKTARCKILHTKIKKTVPALRWIYWGGGYFLQTSSPLLTDSCGISHAQFVAPSFFNALMADA